MTVLHGSAFGCNGCVMNKLKRRTTVRLGCASFALPVRSFPSQNVYRKRFGLTFRLGGRWGRLSVAQFVTRMGLYNQGELDTEVFDGLHDFDDEIEKATFWAEVAGVCDPRRAKATKIRDPLHMFIHRILVAFFPTTSSGKQVSSHVCGGAYITQLADSIGLLIEENIASFTHIVKQTPVGMRLRGRDGQIWDPEEHEEEEEEREEERVHE
ncbi:hypothetical protein R6Q59_007026 [Mikania micrantha]